MKMKQLFNVLCTVLMNSNKPVLLQGAPGVGKSEVVDAVADAIKHRLVVSHPVVEGPTDVKGLPWPGKDGESARFLPYGILAEVLASTEPVLWFLDDLGQAPEAVQAAYMQLLLTRRVGEHVLPPHVKMIAATNGRQHRAGVRGILEPVKSRFVTIIEVIPEIEGWADWAVEHDVPSALIGFLKFRPDLLLAFETENRGLLASPNPRAWSHASELLKLFGEGDTEVLTELISGAVGPEAATELMGYLSIMEDLPDVEYALSHASTFDLPKNLSVSYAFASALAFHANYATLPRVITILTRLADAGQGDAAAFCLNRALKLEPTLADQPEFAMLLANKSVADAIALV